MVKIYCKIIGADYRILIQSGPESKKKIVLLGNAILIPVFLWLATGYLLAHEVLQKEFQTSVICSLFCGLIVFLIERQILMAKGSWKQTAVRIALGFCMASVGSIALDEVIFEEDINFQVQKNKDAHIAKELEIFKKTTESEYLLLSGDAENARKKWQQAMQNALSEADGSGGSGKKGVSAITRLKLASSESLAKDYDIATDKLNKFSLQKTSAVENKTKELLRAFNSNSLLIRIKAMHDLVFENTSMMIVYILFSTVLFILEFIVILTKNSVSTTTYDKKIELIEEIGKYKTEQLLDTTRRAFDPGRYCNSLQNAYKLVESNNPSVFN